MVLASESVPGSSPEVSNIRYTSVSQSEFGFDTLASAIVHGLETQHRLRGCMAAWGDPRKAIGQCQNMFAISRQHQPVRSTNVDGRQM